MLLAGIDLAWKSQNNPSALAFGKLQSDNKLHVVQIHSAITGVEKVLSTIKSEQSLSGIAIDAPLIINNQIGQRSCEKQLSRVYGARGASCHTSNLTLYPKPSSVALSQSLSSLGFMHLGDLSNGQWQIECYPHPALIKIFGLTERLKYKKGSVEEKRKGQVQLATYIKGLQSSAIIRLSIDPQVQIYLDENHIPSLKGRELKENEDVLDAIICLYTAALYAVNVNHEVFGTKEDGYIYVPQQICIEENNVRPDGMLSNEKLKLMIEIAEREARLELGNHPQRNQMGFCHMLWSVQKRILKEKFGVDWKTPAETHKGIMFD